MTLISAMNPGRTGLLASQKMVEITGNNISNVNTPGYSRQTATMSPSAAINQRGLYVGQGVEVKEVRREYDRFISGQLMDQNNVLGREDAKSGPLSELERVFGIGSDALGADIEGFFGAWHDLAENPSGSVEREKVIYEGENLIDSFAHKDSELVRITQNINHTLEAEVDGINQRLQEIARLNADIKTKEGGGYVAHVDHDRRDLLVKEMSAILGVQEYEAGAGQVGLQLPGGLPLVQGDNAVQFESYYDGDDLKFQVRSNDVTLDTTAANFGGQFGGLLDLRDNFIPEMREDTTALRDNIIGEVNGLHKTGYDLDGDQGGDFFDVDEETGTAGIAITSTRQVAAGLHSGAPGDNENALAISGLVNQRIEGGDGTRDETFLEHYSRIASTVGTEARRNIMARDGAKDTMDQLENQRESIVGVSIEEEMINLVMFQKSFEAASRYIGTIDEMLGTIIGMKR